MSSGTEDLPIYADVVDVNRYPIHDLAGGRGSALIARCRSMLDADGACHLPGFITPAAVDAMVQLTNELTGAAWKSDQSHTVYFEPVATGLPPDHPRVRTVRSAKRGIAFDYIPVQAPLRRLYESDDLTRFMAAVLGKPVLHRSADALDALQITRFEPGDELGWHFDRSEFSVTVMYQQAESGGDFVYVPGLRSDDEPNFVGVQQVLDGDASRLKILPSAPGTLAFFHGHDALHRVTPVAGGMARLNSVLTYGEMPDMRLNDLTSTLFYGRTS